MTTILLSYNEVQSLARKAASGAGLPHGVAEDVGQAAVWLSARGVDAIRVVVDALCEGGQRAILDGVAAIDALCCGEPKAIALQDPDCVLLLIGLAGLSATDAGLRIAVERGNGAVIPLSGVNDVHGLMTSKSLLLLPDGGDLAFAPSGAPRPAATDAAAYAAALGLAAKTYVPSSELSRTQGAGAGTTDND